MNLFAQGKGRYIGGALAAVVIICGLGYYALAQWLMPRLLATAPAQIEQLAGQYINGSVKVGSVSWEGGFTASAHQVQVFDQKQALAAEIPSLEVSLNPFKLPAGITHTLSTITLNKPVVYLTRDQKDNWNLQDFLKPSQSQETPFYGKLLLKKGEICVRTPEGDWRLQADGRVDGSGNPDFALGAVVQGYGDTIKVDGVLNKKMQGRLYVKTQHLGVAPYAAWAEKYAKLQGASGALKEVDLSWHNDGSRVELSGSGTLDRVGGNYPLSQQLLPVFLSGQVTFDKTYAAVNRFTAEIDGQKAFLDGHVDFTDLDKLQGHALITAPSLSWQGETVTKFKLPVDLVDSKILIPEASFAYGGGRVAVQGNYDPKTGALLALADVNKVSLSRGPLAEHPLTLTGSFGCRGTVTQDKLELNAVSNTAAMQWQQVKLQLLDFDVSLDKDKAVIHNFSLRAGASGSLALKGEATWQGHLQAEGRLSEFPVGPFMALAGYEGSGLASGSFKASGTKDDFNFEGMTQIQQLQCGKIRVPNAHGFVRMKHNVLTLNDYQVYLDQGKNVINGTVDFSGADPAADLKVETQKVRAEALAAMSGKDLPVTGNIDNRVHITGTLAHPHVHGDIRLSDGSAEGYLIDLVTGTYAYDDGAVDLDNFVVRALSCTLTMNGTMDRAQNLNFRAAAENVDLAKLPLKSEQVVLGGLLSAKGTLTGTLSQPLFAGQVSSKEFLVNGQPIRNLKGSLTANGRDINHLQGTAEQPNPDSFDGLYSIDLNYDAVRKAPQGSINVSYGKLASLLKMARQDYDMDGDVSGSFEINQKGIGTGGNFQMEVGNLRIHKLIYHQLLISGHTKNNIVTFDEAHLQEEEGQSDKGFIALGGNIDFGRRTLNIEIGGREADPKLITSVMKDPVDISGTMNMALQLSGSFDDPVGNGSVELDNGAIANVSVDKAIAMVSLKNDQIKLEQALLTKNEYKINASGTMPMDIFRAARSRKNPAAQMNIKVDLSQAGLGILSAVKGVEWAVGPIQGNLTVSGNLEEPLLNGRLQVNNGAVKLKHVTTLIDKIKLDVNFAGNKVNINTVEAMLGKGKVSGSGTYALRSTAREAYKFTMAARNAEIDSTVFKGRLNADAEISPHMYKINRHPVGAEEMKFGYRPKITANVKVDDALINVPSIPQFGEGESNLGLNVTVTLGPKVHLYNKYLYNMWLKGGIHVGGSTRYLVPSGTIEATRGTVTYLRTIFKLEKALAHWTEPGTILPTIEVAATTKFNRYRVLFKLDGPLSGNLNTSLTSDPPLNKSAIMRMLTLQRVSAGSDEVTGADLQNMVTAGLEMALFGDIEQFVRETFGIDQFRVYTGRLNSGVDIDTDVRRDLTPEERGQYNFLVGKNLSDRLSLGYTASLNGQYNNLYTQYAVSDHINFTAAKDQDSKKKFSLEYRISF